MARTPDDPTKAQAWITKGLDDLDFEFYIPSGPKGDPGGFVTGTLLGASNLNSITTPGLYRTTSGANTTFANNYPVNQNGGILIVTEMATGYVVQTYEAMNGTSQSGSTMYKRQLANGTWTPWKAYNSTRVDQTAGRAIYQWDDLNAREQLIYGDTGWRNLNGYTNAGALANGASGPFIRRIGNMVTIDFGDLTSGTNEATVLANEGLFILPVGFRPHAFGGWFRGLLSRGDGASTTARLVQYEIPVNGTNPFSVRVMENHRTPFSSTIRFSGVVMFPTIETWPTSLPGAAAATIPNL